MKTNIFIMIVMFCLILPGFPGYLLHSQDSAIDPGLDYIEEIGDGASMNWTTKMLQVKGNGFGPERVKHLGRRKILAKRAAKVDAYRNLAEVIKGVRVTAHTTVEDMMLASDLVNAKTVGMIKGMKLKEVIYSSEGGCEVTVEVNFDRDGRFLLEALQHGEVRVTDNYPKFDWVKERKRFEKARREVALLKTELKETKDIANDLNYRLADRQSKTRAKEEEYLQHIKGLQGETGEKPLRTGSAGAPQTRGPTVSQVNYTGLLVDARGLDLKPAKHPSLLNQSKEKVYGIGVIPANIPPGSTADYSLGNIEYARKNKKICSQPLVVKGIEVVNDSDIVINNDEVRNLVRILPQLEQAKVVILHEGQ